MAREIKPGSYVQIVVDHDSGLLVGKKGTVKSIANDKYWVTLAGHPIPLPFGADEIKAANRTKRK